MHIKTYIGKAYYISTNDLDLLMFPLKGAHRFETMVFRVKQGNVDWTGIETEFAKSRAVAIHQHLKAIVKYTKGGTV